MSLVKKVRKVASHRNGVCGKPFSVVTFTSKGNQNMIAILTEDEGECYVLDLDLASQGVIEFGANSWRGDWYETELRKAIALDEERLEKEYGRA